MIHVNTTSTATSIQQLNNKKKKATTTARGNEHTASVTSTSSTTSESPSILLRFPFHESPDDIQLEIVLFLDLATLLAFSEVSTYCYTLANRDLVWKSLLRSRWNAFTVNYAIARQQTPMVSHPSLSPTAAAASSSSATYTSTLHQPTEEESGGDVGGSSSSTMMMKKKKNETEDVPSSHCIKPTYKDHFKTLLDKGPRWRLVGKKATHIHTVYFGTKIVRNAEWIALSKLLFMNRVLYTSGKHYFEVKLPPLEYFHANPRVRVGVILDNEDREFGYNYDVDVNSIFIPKPPAVFDAHAGNIVVYNLLPTWCYTYTLTSFKSCTKFGGRIGIYVDCDEPLIALYLQQNGAEESSVVPPWRQANGKLAPLTTQRWKKPEAETFVCPLSQDLFRSSYMQGFRLFVEFNEVNSSYAIETDFGADVPATLQRAIDAVDRKTPTPTVSYKIQMTQQPHEEASVAAPD